MARRTSRKNRERAARTQSPSSDGGESYTAERRPAPSRRERSSVNVNGRRSRSKLSEDETYSGRSRYTSYQSKSATNLLDKKRSMLQSPRKSAPSKRLPFTGADARSPAQSPRYGEDYNTSSRQRRKSRDNDESDRDRSYTPVQRSRHSQTSPRSRQEQNYTPKQSHVQRRGRKMRDASSDCHNATDRSVSSNAGYRNTRKTSPSHSPAPRRKSGERRQSGGSDRRRQTSPRPELNKVQSDKVGRSRRTRSPYTSSRKRRADTYPSPSRDHSASPRARRRGVSPVSKSPAPKPQRQRSLTPPGRRQPYTSRRSPRAPSTRARSPSAPELKTYRLSELIPECRLYHIEARGGRRDFRKWFSTLPPNVQVDKDMKTDRGVFKKDNFATSAKLDEYLGLNRSHSPPDSRSRRQRR